MALNRGAILVASTALLGLASVAHAERHYDCSKPGNANKAVCKTAPATTAPPAGSAPATAPATAPITSSTRHYDCSKPGNAKKAACKGAAPATTTVTTANAAPAAAPAKPSVFSRILKPKAQAPAPAAANNAPAAAPAATATAAPTASFKGKSITADAAGATGQCRDGSYTHATHHSGACSSHGGVAKWMQ